LLLRRVHIGPCSVDGGGAGGGSVKCCGLESVKSTVRNDIHSHLKI